MLQRKICKIISSVKTNMVPNSVHSMVLTVFKTTTTRKHLDRRSMLPKGPTGTWWPCWPRGRGMGWLGHRKHMTRFLLHTDVYSEFPFTKNHYSFTNRWNLITRLTNQHILWPFIPDPLKQVCAMPTFSGARVSELPSPHSGAAFLDSQVLEQNS